MTDAAKEVCATCLKAAEFCVCADVVLIANRVELLVLQHPQEQDRTLGTARLAVAHFRTSSLKVGLSWPSLSRLLGRDVDPQAWAVLYLGSSRAEEVAPDQRIVVLDRDGQPAPGQRHILRELEGVIVLDGTWSQAKALWWRNAWMLKCRRVILNPDAPSLYGVLRREPRADGLSTLEATAMLMAEVERDPGIADALLGSFRRMLEAYRAAKPPRPAKRDWRRRRPRTVRG